MERNRPSYLLLSLIIVISVLDSKIFLIEEKNYYTKIL